MAPAGDSRVLPLNVGHLCTKFDNFRSSFLGYRVNELSVTNTTLIYPTPTHAYTHMQSCPHNFLFSWKPKVQLTGNICPSYIKIHSTGVVSTMDVHNYCKYRGHTKYVHTHSNTYTLDTQKHNESLTVRYSLILTHKLIKWLQVSAFKINIHPLTAEES